VGRLQASTALANALEANPQTSADGEVDMGLLDFWAREHLQIFVEMKVSVELEGTVVEEVQQSCSARALNQPLRNAFSQGKLPHLALVEVALLLRKVEAQEALLAC